MGKNRKDAFFIECFKTALVIEDPAAKNAPDKKIIGPARHFTSPGTPDIASRKQPGPGGNIRSIPDCADKFGYVLHICGKIDIVITDNFSFCQKKRTIERFTASQAFIAVHQVNT